MKVKIEDKQFLVACSLGVFNLFKLNEEGQFVLMIVHDKGYFCVPIINKKIYIDAEDEVEEVISTVVQSLLDHNAVFKEISKLSVADIRTKAAPEHTKVVKNAVAGHGVRQHPEAAKYLKECGYTIEETSFGKEVAVKDYHLEDNPEMMDSFEENKAELAKVGATFSSVGLETQEAYEAAMACENGGIIFEGPTGTGKTWNCKILAVHSKAGLKNIQITYGTSIEDLVGMFTPNDESDVELSAVRGSISMMYKKLSGLTKKDGETVDAFNARFVAEQDKVTNEVLEMVKSSGGSSKWKFVPGPLLVAYKDGWQIYLDEINYGQAGVLACINQFTDGTKRITINGKTYKRNPNFVIYMTMNPGYEGTDPLNVALKNRFAKVNVPVLSKEEFTSRMIGYSKGLGHALSSEFFGKLYDFAGTIEALGNSTEYHENVKFSIRNAQRLCDSILRKGKTIEKFSANIAVQYLNDLTTDNDNSEKVERLKADSNVVNMIQELYSLYDFAEIPVATKSATLSELFTTVEEKPEGAESDSLVSDEDLDSLMGDL